MKRLTENNKDYQANYKRINKDRLSMQRREMYRLQQLALGKTVRPTKLERLNMERAVQTQCERNRLIKLSTPVELIIKPEEESIPVYINPTDIYESRIDELYAKLATYNPLSKKHERIYSQINNYSVKIHQHERRTQMC